MSDTQKPRSSVKAAAYAVTGVLILLLFELGSFVVLTYVVEPRDQSAFYEPPEIDPVAYAQYRQHRDPQLGWPFVGDADVQHRDAAGSRRIPTFPEPGGECVSAFGDSFIYGDEVDDEDAWSNVLSERLGCRVANYGVPGYGTDQALMRFRKLPDDGSSVAILGVFPHNTMRNVNQYRYFLTATTEFGFKPRFVLEDGSLRSVPMPDMELAELEASLLSPGDYYEHEAFLPGSSKGPIALSFPYTAVFLKYVMSERIRYFIRGWPSWSGYVREGHPSGSLEVTSAIVDAFVATAAQRGKSAIIVTFPTASSFEMYAEQGNIPYQPMLDAFASSGAHLVDLHAPILDHLDGASICTLLTNAEYYVGHFNPEGNALVADTIRAKLVDAGLLP